jgi:hypothetical protein
MKPIVGIQPGSEEAKMKMAKDSRSPLIQGQGRDIEMIGRSSGDLRNRRVN